jgi:hypothetical protein
VVHGGGDAGAGAIDDVALEPAGRSRRVRRDQHLVGGKERQRVVEREDRTGVADGRPTTASVRSMGLSMSIEVSSRRFEPLCGPKLGGP